VGRGRWHRSDRELDLGGVVRETVQSVQQREPITDAVVDADDECVAFLEAVDQVDLPQGLARVERPTRQLGDVLTKPSFALCPWDRDVLQMVIQVELLVQLPRRPLVGALDDSLPESRERHDPFCDESP